MFVFPLLIPLRGSQLVCTPVGIKPNGDSRCQSCEGCSNASEAIKFTLPRNLLASGYNKRAFRWISMEALPDCFVVYFRTSSAP